MHRRRATVRLQSSAKQHLKALDSQSLSLLFASLIHRIASLPPSLDGLQLRRLAFSGLPAGFLDSQSLSLCLFASLSGQSLSINLSNSLWFTRS